MKAYDQYFVQRTNAAGTLGMSSLTKMTATLRTLAYGARTYYCGEHLRIAESTAIESLEYFVQDIVKIFSHRYLRLSNSDDIARLLAVGEQLGFPGMLGSIDCIHWRWKNCPTAGKGSHNDINVLERSSLFAELAEGRTPPVNYSINGHDYTMGYYLADGIYPQWSTFVKTIPSPQGNKRKYFATAQDSVRKAVEHAFGVLQSRFAIVQRPTHFLNREVLKDIMKACIILHDMIIEDERDFDGSEDCDYDTTEHTPAPAQVSQEHIPALVEFIGRHHRIRDRHTHSQLRANLVEHLWQLHSQS